MLQIDGSLTYFLRTGASLQINSGSCTRRPVRHAYGALASAPPPQVLCSEPKTHSGTQIDRERDDNNDHQCNLDRAFDASRFIAVPPSRTREYSVLMAQGTYQHDNPGLLTTSGSLVHKITRGCRQLVEGPGRRTTTSKKNCNNIGKY